MLCPYCSKHIHFEISDTMAFEFECEDNDDETYGIGFAAGICPSCNQIIVLYQEGEYCITSSNRSFIEDVTVKKIIYPLIDARDQLPPEVLEEFREDFNEASLVLNLSPKASAALSRRCLQRFFHNKLGIVKGSLVTEIEEFIQTQKAPSYVLEVVDAVRNIGNFAAHPIKDKNTGEIVDVEPGEAEWLLEVLEALFDFYFVQPAKLEERKNKLNQKLASFGKPLMK